MAVLNRPSQTKESSHEMGAELLGIKIQLTHPLSDSLTVTAGTLLLTVFCTVQEKRKDLIFVLERRGMIEPAQSKNWNDLCRDQRQRQQQMQLSDVLNTLKTSGFNNNRHLHLQSCRPRIS